MAKNQSTSRGAKQFASDLWGENFFKAFEAQPAQITDKQMAELELAFTGNAIGVWRRMALGTLARSGSELVEASAASSRDVALELARAQDEISKYATRLRDFADMM